MKLLLLLATPALLMAQRANLSGLVKGLGQAAVPDASLTASHVETGTERNVRSSSAGIYSLSSLAPGHYNVTVEAKGYQVKTVENVELQPDQNARLDFTLEGAAGDIRGMVADARGGEALSNVRIQLAGAGMRATTGADGSFHLVNVPPGDYVLNIATVGYHMERRGFHLGAGESYEFSIVLTPDTLQQTDTVVAQSDPFEPMRPDNPNAISLRGIDAKNLGTVLADDPLRAVQGLPGVSSNKDFDARFSLHGADFSRIGLYLDGVLLHEPFHMPKTPNVPGTVAAFNPDMIEEMDLHEAAFPSRFADRTAGILDVETRDGSRNSRIFRVGASSSNAEFQAEGPLGRASGGKPKGSWVAAARKSYLTYVLARTNSQSSMIFDMDDVEARASYDFTHHRVSLSLLEGFSRLDQSHDLDRLGINSVLKAGYHYTLANLGWHYSPSSRLLIVSRLAWMREKYNDITPQSLPLAGGYYGEWVWSSSATWMWGERSPLETGWSARRVRSRDFWNQYQTGSGAARFLDYSDGTALRSGGYAQQSWSGWDGRIRLHAGARWDDHSIDRVAAVSPQASAAFALSGTTRLNVAWGQYVQYPEIAVLTSPFGNRGLLPARSIHETLSLEQRLGARTRLRAEFYNRDDRDLAFQSLYDPRVLNGAVAGTPASPLYYNALRGRSRGASIFLQRASANRFTGWVSYTYGRDMMRDGVSGQSFFSDYDQRHTVNGYGGYRIRPTVNLSLRLTYGSAFPIPGYLTRADSGVYLLAPSRNQLRLPEYQRTDLRVNKAWVHSRWKYTLYGELLNLTNHGNYFFQSFNGYNGRTGQASLTITKTFPILPSLGMQVEW